MSEELVPTPESRTARLKAWWKGDSPSAMTARGFALGASIPVGFAMGVSLLTIIDQALRARNEEDAEDTDD